MADIDRLAQALFGGRRAESQEVLTDATTRTYIGTAVTGSEDGSAYVTLDGDVTLPDDLVDPDGNVVASYEDIGIEMATGPSVEAGDDVVVTLVGGGPLKTPMVTSVAGEGDAQNQRIETIEADYVKATELEADVAYIGFLKADSATITSLQAEAAKVASLTAEQLNAAAAYVGELTADSVTAQQLSAAAAYVGTLVADELTARQIVANVAKISSLTAEQLSAATAYVGALTAGSVSAQQLIADHATVGSLDASYARLDTANIDTATIREAWVNALMVQSGLIAHEGTVYTLDAIQVNAANVTAGTLDVERLVVTVAGEKYLVHVDPSTGSPSYQKLDGGIIGDLTITADKLVAGAVTAEKITTENIVGSGGWINLRSGTFRYLNATTGNGIIWDGQRLTIVGDVLMTSGDSIPLEEVVERVGDVERAQAAAVVETTQLWCASAGYPSAPLSPVTGEGGAIVDHLGNALATDSGDVVAARVLDALGNEWLTYVPAWDPHYPNYFYCFQHKRSDGTYEWGEVVYDRATTESQQASAQAASDAEAAKDLCTISITSTNGLVFKQNMGVSTTLVVTLFTAGGDRIETAAQLSSRFGAGAYLQWRWKNAADDDFSTISAADPRVADGGFRLTVSPGDISTQAVIDCQLIY